MENEMDFNTLALHIGRNIKEFRKKLGTATKEELNQINTYKAILVHNPVHPLMQKGMYQAIVEDINPNDIESIGRINKVLSKIIIVVIK